MQAVTSVEQAITPAEQAAQQKRRYENRQVTRLIGPASVWLIVFFMLPLVVILIYSFLARGEYGGIEMQVNLDNYAKLLNPNYFVIFVRSLWISLLTTIACLLVGYPMAYFIARQPPRWRNMWVLLVIIPFWTNFLVRTYAVMTLLRTEGVVNSILTGLGLIQDPLNLLYTPFAVLMGEIYGFLPFMVLPLYATIEKFDFALMEAAHDAGANDFWAFWRVMVPLTMPGIVAGSILVFIPAIGAFITPVILGGDKVMMIGNLIDQEFKRGRDWPLASAISITLMIMVSIATALYFRTTNEGERL